MTARPAGRTVLVVTERDERGCRDRLAPLKADVFPVEASSVPSALRTTAAPADYPRQLRRRLSDPQRLGRVHAVPQEGPWRERAKVLVQLAAQMLDTEIAEVNLVTDTEMVCIASAAGNERSVPVEVSYCQHVVGTGDAVVVYESTDDPLVRDSPTAPRLHCYLGIPLSSGGQVLGALCVAGADPREWTDVEVSLLTELADELLDGTGWAA